MQDDHDAAVRPGGRATIRGSMTDRRRADQAGQARREAAGDRGRRDVATARSTSPTSVI
jgi:hypothetical protein